MLKNKKLAFAFMLLLALLAQCFYAAWDTGQTVDETFFNGSGYPIVRYNDYRILGEHPPLMMQLGSLPLLFIQPKYPIDDPIYLPNGHGIDVSKMGSKFLYGMGNNAQLTLFLERLPIILLTAILGVVLYQWSYQLYGLRGAVISLLLFCFSPNIIANGSLFTTDMGITVFFFLAIYQLKKFFSTFSIKDGLFVGVFCGFAFLSKMSALLLFPTILVLFLLSRIFRRSEEIMIPEGEKKLRLSVCLLALALFTVAIGQKTMLVGLGPLCILILWTSWYQDSVAQKYSKISKLIGLLGVIGWIICFTFVILMIQKRPPFIIASSFFWIITVLLLSVYLIRKKISLKDLYLLQIFCLIWFVVSLIIIFGYTDFLESAKHLNFFRHYIRAFHIASSHSLSEHNGCIENSFITCDWRYFPGTILVKTPVTVLVFTLIGSFILISLRKYTLMTKALIFIPPVLFFLFACFVNKINIGVRHILPIYPFLFLIAGSVSQIEEVIKLSHVKKYITGIITIFLCVHIVGTLRTAPDYLSYFNEFVGNAENGAKLVLGSNTIWGQDNLRLIKLVKQKQIPHIVIASTASNAAEYEYYQIPWSYFKENELSNPKPGFYALDVVFYNAEQRKIESWFKSRRPLYKAGRTFYVFEVK